VGDAAEAAADLILARRAWPVAARDDNCDDNGKEGNPPVPNNATVDSGGDNSNALSADNDAIRDASAC
jgi:hypothetical protein